MQNYIDDVACCLARLPALLCWHDPTASALFLGVLLVVPLVLLLLGLPTLLCIILLWQVRGIVQAGPAWLVGMAVGSSWAAGCVRRGGGSCRTGFSVTDRL